MTRPSTRIFGVPPFSSFLREKQESYHSNGWTGAEYSIHIRHQPFVARGGTSLTALVVDGFVLETFQILEGLKGGNKGVQGRELLGQLGLSLEKHLGRLPVEHTWPS